MTVWLTILGVGANGLDGLPSAARAVLDNSEFVVGSERILKNSQIANAEIHTWTSPFEDMLDRIEGWNGRNVTVLATGDPMHYGIGATLARRISPEEMTVIPSPSAFSLAAARLFWPLQEVETLSLHGRSASLLEPFIQPDAKLFVLTGGGETIHEAAMLLRARGFGPSKLTVLENMGSADERVVTLAADDSSGQEYDEFNTLAIECIASPDAQILPRTPGLPDDAYTHDGQLTKSEVRAITLSALGPTPGALLWDVGAGCGSVAIEWIRASLGARAIAFERHEDRIRMIAENAVALGAPDLDVVAGDVEQSLKGHASPSAIFLGGAITSDGVFEACWSALPLGGRLAANAVTLEGEAALIARHQTHGGELARIAVSHVTPVGTRRAMRPRMSVLQWRVTKA